MNVSSNDGMIPENLFTEWYTVNAFPFFLNSDAIH